ncbi:MAG: hypothetical protein ABIB97_05910 [Patescibacteria group bacterium]
MKEYRPKEKKPAQLVGGKNFDYYLGIILLPIIVVTIAEAVMIVFEVKVYFFWIINVVSFIYVGWAIYLRRRDSFTEAGTAAAMMGVLIGLLIAIFKIIYFRKVYLIFNLIAEPVRTGILGLVVVWLLHLILSLTKSQPASGKKDTYLSSLVKRVNYKK